MPILEVPSETRDVVLQQELKEYLLALEDDGVLYFGFPVLAGVEGTQVIDALLVSRNLGVVAFLFANSPYSVETFSEIADDTYVLLEGSLRKNPALRQTRSQLKIPLSVFFYSRPEHSTSRELVLTRETIVDELGQHRYEVEDDLLGVARASIEELTLLRAPQRRTEGADTPLSTLLREIDDSIRGLDQQQRLATLVNRVGPSRIRGLAGSGKTVVLALKAALLHVKHPEWTIGVTFFTRSLYQQFTDLVYRYCLSKQREPDWSKIRILHAWGASDKMGFYRELCKSYGVIPLSFTEAQMGDPLDPFGFACAQLKDKIGANPTPIFDALLIDEAQDLPQPFFELAYLSLTDQKRVTYAYDELQNLSDFAMRPPEELFGRTVDGQPRVVTEHDLHDIVLRKCYRNTPWALTIAHALGFGVYREADERQPLVQFFHDLSLWSAIGYDVVSGDLELGSPVELKRAEDSYPSFFAKYLTADSAFHGRSFDSSESQASAVASEIRRLITDEGLSETDFLVVFTNPRTAKAEAGPLLTAMSNYDLAGHLVGVSASRDEVFKPGSVALASVLRAKGNEAAVVFVMHSEHCFEGPQLSKLRNRLFTAITRSRAVVYMFGIGARMNSLLREVDRVRELEYTLRFRVPTETELLQIRSIHRDRSSEELENIEAITKSAQEILRRVQLLGYDEEELRQVLSDQELRDLSELVRRISS